jgi:hypothetical protein
VGREGGGKEAGREAGREGELAERGRGLLGNVDKQVKDVHTVYAQICYFFNQNKT